MFLNLITPELGLIVWQLVVFLAVLFVLGKFAWKPILKGIKDREQSITEALEAAQQAKSEMAKISADNEKLLQQARIEKDEMLKKAQQTAKDLVEEAKTNAQKEASKVLEEARQLILSEQKAAMAQIKKEIAQLSLEIAERLLRKDLQNDNAQKMLAEQLINEIKPN
ncbi:MAG: F0F1 ATP synthase subunit B [Thermonemataceae bacterium]|nr:F0F1 ATP synthase subunit B [Thermonemataceae bacterium]